MKELLFRKYLKAYEQALREPALSQQKVLQYLISQGKMTFYGLMNNYSEINDYTDFKRIVPIVKHEDLWPYIKSDLSKKMSQLWPTKSKFFAQSSGTTSAKKIIPVSLESLRNNHVLAGRMLIANYIFNLNPAFQPFLGKSFALAGSRQYNSNYPEAYIADVSALLLTNLPWWAKLFTAPKISISTSDMHWNNKLTAIARDLMKRNVISLSGVPSWMMRVLETTLKISGKEKIINVWPNLSLFIHGGVNFAPYEQRFTQMLGKPIDFLNCYNASEGFFAFQDRLNCDDMLLLPNVGIFYEFRELNSKEAIPLSQVEKNKVYALIISTNAGLWRYEIGDTILFTELNPFRIKIAGRTQQCINLVGEELMVNQAEKALSFCAILFGFDVVDFTIAPLIDNGRNYHQWYLEIDKGSKLENLPNVLDSQLKNLNADYMAKREGGLLELPIVEFLKPGTFQRYFTKMGRLGGQNKTPRLSESNQFIKELLEIQ